MNIFAVTRQFYTHSIVLNHIYSRMRRAVHLRGLRSWKKFCGIVFQLPVTPKVLLESRSTEEEEVEPGIPTLPSLPRASPKIPSDQVDTSEQLGPNEYRCTD